MDTKSRLIIAQETVRVTDVKNSYWMEVERLKQCLDKLNDDGVEICTLSTDQHPSIRKTLADDYPHIKHEYDLWHIVKSLKKKMLSAKKADIVPWINAIANHLWYCASAPHSRSLRTGALNPYLISGRYTGNEGDTKPVMRMVALMNDDRVLHALKKQLYPKELYEKLDTLTSKLETLTTQLTDKDNIIHMLDTTVNHLEQYSRCPNLRIQGILEDVRGESVDPEDSHRRRECLLRKRYGANTQPATQ